MKPELGALPASAEVKLARRIAEEVKRWTREGCDLGRAVQAGDVLILVRRRGKIFEAVIRALKRAGVPSRARTGSRFRRISRSKTSSRRGVPRSCPKTTSRSRR